MNQIEFDLFQENVIREEQVSNSNSQLSIPLQNAVLQLLSNEYTSVREICEHLIKLHNAPKNRYSTDKPRIYPLVCLFLDSMVLQGELLLVKGDDVSDRVYKLAE